MIGPTIWSINQYQYPCSHAPLRHILVCKIFGNTSVQSRCQTLYTVPKWKEIKRWKSTRGAARGAVPHSWRWQWSLYTAFVDRFRRRFAEWLIDGRWNDRKQTRRRAGCLWCGHFTAALARCLSSPLSSAPLRVTVRAKQIDLPSSRRRHSPNITTPSTTCCCWTRPRPSLFVTRPPAGPTASPFVSRVIASSLLTLFPATIVSARRNRIQQTICHF